MYMLQNVMVAASAAAVFPLLGSSPPGGLLFWALTCATIACGSASSVGEQNVITLMLLTFWPQISMRQCLAQLSQLLHEELRLQELL